MKLLVLLFLVGCASAFAPRHVAYDDVLEHAVDEVVNDLLGDEPVERLYRDEGGDSQSELEKKVRESFEKLLEKVKESIERGKTVREDVLEKLKELKQKMKDLRIDMGEKAKDLYNKIKEKARDFLQKLLDKLGLKDEKRALSEAYGFDELEDLVRRAEEDEDSKTELEQKVREAFDRLLEHVKEAIERGKTVKQDVLDKLQSLREKMKELHIDMGERAKEMFKKIKEKAKEFLQKLLEKLGLKDNDDKRALRGFEAEIEAIVKRAEEDENSRSELEQKVREAFDRLLEHVKDAVERGKTVKEEVVQKLEKLREKMKELKIDVSERAKDLYGKIKEKAKEFIKNLLDRLGLQNKKEERSIDEIDEILRRSEGSDYEQKLREAFEKVLEKVKDAIEKGKTIKEELIEKLKSLKDKMKEKRIDMTEKAKQLFQKLKEKARDFIQKLLDRLDDKKDKESFAVAHIDFNIKSIFKNLKDSLLQKLDKEKIKAKIEELFGKGSELADKMLDLLKSKGEKGKEKLLELVDRILGEDEEKREERSLQDLYDKVRDYFKNLNIELKEKYVKFGEWAKETLKKGIDHSKSKIENIKALAKEFVEHAKQARKDIAVEALEFLRPYKEDLGVLWQRVKDSVQEVLKREE